MSHKLIWFVSIILSVATCYGFSLWKPYFFGRFIMEGALNQWHFSDAISYEPSHLIIALMIGFGFLLYSNVLHTLLYRRRVKTVTPKVSERKFDFPAIDPMYRIQAEEKDIREQLRNSIENQRLRKP